MSSKRYLYFCFCMVMILLAPFVKELSAESHVGTGSESNNRRTLLCIANAYAYMENEEESSIDEDVVVSAAVQLVRKNVKEYLKKHLNKGTTYRFLPEGKDSFRILNTYRVDSKKTADNLLGIRIGGVVEYEIDGRASEDFLTVSVDSDQLTYTEGEELLFLLSGNHDFHMCLIEEAPDKTVTQLLPNYFKAEEHFSSGQHLFPDEVSGDKFKFIIGPPFGEATIHMFASEEPVGGISVLDEKSGYFIQTVESMAEIREKLMKNIMDSLELSNAQVTFQCVQFVENTKKISLMP